MKTVMCNYSWQLITGHNCFRKFINNTLIIHADNWIKMNNTLNKDII